MIIWDENVKKAMNGSIRFGRDTNEGYLHYQVVFELPVASFNGDFQIFQHTGTIITTREIDPKEEYKAAFIAISRLFEEWSRMIGNGAKHEKNTE